MRADRNQQQPTRTKPMKNSYLMASMAAAALGLAALGMTGCQKPATPDSSARAVQYTCPMHPEVVKDAPGNCPKCGMKLVEKH